MTMKFPEFVVFPATKFCVTCPTNCGNLIRYDMEFDGRL